MNQINYPLIIVLFLTTILHILFIWEFSSSPFFENPIIDGKWFDDMAWALANDSLPSLSEVVFRAPLYPNIVAFLYRIGGHNYWLPRLWNSLMVLITLVVIYKLTEKILQPRFALIAVIIGALYGPFYFFISDILITNTTMALNMCWLYYLYRLNDKEHSYLWVLSGLILGLAALARPNILLAFPLIFLVGYDSSHYSLKTHFINIKQAKRLLFAIIGLTVVILPTSARNHRLSGDFILISSQAGLNFFLGNNEIADGWNTQIPGLKGWRNPDVQALTERELGHKVSPTELSDYWAEKAFHFIRENPIAAAKLLFRKSFAYFSGFEIKNNQDIYALRRYSIILSILTWHKWMAFPFGIVGPLGVIGLFIMLKSYRNESLLLFSFTLIYAVSVIIFFVCDRYRLPSVPGFIIGFTVFIAWCRNSWQQRKQQLIVISTLAFIMIITFNYDLFGFEIEDEARFQFDLGLVTSRSNQWYSAVNHYEKAVELQPKYTDAWYNLANVYNDMSDYRRAIAAYDRAFSLDPSCAHCLINKAVALTHMRRMDDAITTLEQALAISPNYPAIYVNLATAYVSQQQLERAEQICREGLRLSPNFAPLWVSMGIVLDKLGRKDEAVEAFRQALRLNPQEQFALRYLSKTGK